MEKELTRLYELIDDIKTAMMTTRRADGHMRSRAMATQRQADGADLWFVTIEDSAKLNEIAYDPHVNLSYFREKTMEWVSVSGIAYVVRDRAKIAELWAPDWKVWFPDEGDPRHGTADDPRIVLIGVRVHHAEFLEVNEPRPVVLFEIMKGWVTGQEPKVGEMHEVYEPRRRAAR